MKGKSSVLFNCSFFFLITFSSHHSQQHCALITLGGIQLYPRTQVTIHLCCCCCCCYVVVVKSPEVPQDNPEQRWTAFRVASKFAEVVPQLAMMPFHRLFLLAVESATRVLTRP